MFAYKEGNTHVIILFGKSERERDKYRWVSLPNAPVSTVSSATSSCGCYLASSSRKRKRGEGRGEEGREEDNEKGAERIHLFECRKEERMRGGRGGREPSFFAHACEKAREWQLRREEIQGEEGKEEEGEGGNGTLEVFYLLTIYFYFFIFIFICFKSFLFIPLSLFLF